MSITLRLSAAVGAGAALGSVARHLATLALQVPGGMGFPWGTLAVNVSGSALIGLLAAWAARPGRAPVPAELRFFALAGFCGGFTTFSIFSLETLLMLERGATGQAVVHAGVSLALWMLAVWIGAVLGARMGPAVAKPPEAR